MALEKTPVEQPDASINPDINIEAFAQGKINEKALLRKLDWRLLPAVSVLYLLSFLDRSNGTLLPSTSTL